MGTISVVENILRPTEQRLVDFTGPLHVAITTLFPPPNAFGGRNGRIFVNDEELDLDDWWTAEIGERDRAMIALAPGDPVTQFVVQVALAISATLIAQALAPKPKRFVDNPEPSAVYSVGVEGNEAKLGGVIPVHYGITKRAPDLATQSYRRFANNEETRYILLCLGAGEFDAANTEVFIGNSPASSFPADALMWEQYGPADHGEVFGNIESDFGLHEDVFSVAEVDGQRLIPIDANADDVETLGVEFIAVGSAIAMSGTTNADIGLIGAGQQVRFENLSSADAGAPSVSNFTSTVQAITGPSSFTISTSQLAGYEWTADLTVIGAPTVEIAIGPFAACLPGQETDELEVDIEFPGGLYDLNTDGTFANKTVSIVVKVQEIDDNGAAVGSPEDFNFSFTRQTSQAQRFTLTINPAAGLGRYEVSVARTTAGDDGGQSEVFVTGIRSYLDYAAGPKYGKVTLLALKIKGSERFSDASLGRIQVRTRRLLPPALDEDGALGFRRAPDDIFADILTNPHYSLGLTSADDLDASITDMSSPLLNGVFDTETTVFEALEAVAQAARAQPVQIGNQIGVVIDEAVAASSLITPDQIIQGSYSKSVEIGTTDEVDGYTVQYRDALSFDPVEVTRPVDAIRPQLVRVWGLRDATDAAAYADYLWNVRLRRNTIHSFRVELEGRLFEKGQRIRLVPPDQRYVRFYEGTRYDPTDRILYVSGTVVGAVGAAKTILVADSKGQLFTANVTVAAGNGYQFAAGQVPDGAPDPQNTIRVYDAATGTVSALELLIDQVVYDDQYTARISAYNYDAEVY